MNPNTNLQKQLEKADAILNGHYQDSFSEMILEDQLAEMVLELHQHLMDGGELPEVWALHSQDSRFVRVKK